MFVTATGTEWLLQVLNFISRTTKPRHTVKSQGPGQIERERVCLTSISMLYVRWWCQVQNVVKWITQGRPVEYNWKKRALQAHDCVLNHDLTIMLGQAGLESIRYIHLRFTTHLWSFFIIPNRIGRKATWTDVSGFYAFCEWKPPNYVDQ